MKMIEIVKPRTESEIEGVANVDYSVDKEIISRFWTENYSKEFEKSGLEGSLASAKQFPDNILAAKDGEKVVGMIVFCRAYENFEGKL